MKMNKIVKRQNNVENVLDKRAMDTKLNALYTRKENAFSTIEYLKANAAIEVSLKAADSVTSALGRIGYVAGSQVGLITNVFAVASVLIDETYNQQFCYPGTDIVSMELLKKVFLTVNTQPQAGKDTYNSIFTEEGDNANIILVENKQGRQLRLARALKHDINDFADELSFLSSLKKADLVKIGRDLEKIGRVMQELEIDSAKKPTIKDGILELTKFMNTFGCSLASNYMGRERHKKAIRIEDNFATIIAEKKSKEGKVTTKFSYKFDEFDKLENALDKANKAFEDFSKAYYADIEKRVPQEEMEAYMNIHADEINTDLNKKKKEIFRNEINGCYIEDGASVLKKAIAAEQETILNKLVDMYSLSNMNLFNQFKSAYKVKVNELNASLPEGEKITNNVIDTIKYMAIKSVHMIYEYFALKGDVATLGVDELASNLRSAMYRYGADYGLTPEATFLIAAAAGWLRVNNSDFNNAEKFVEKPSYSYKALALMFTNEFKFYFNPEAMNRPVDVILPLGCELEIGAYMFFEDGQAELDLVDGGTGYATLKKDNFTGYVRADVTEDGDVEFIKIFDAYEYNDEIEFLLLDSIVDMSTNDFVFDVDAQDVEASFMKSTKKLERRDANPDKNIESNYEQISETFTKFNKYMKLGLDENLPLSFRVKDKNLFLKNSESGRIIMLGRFIGIQSRENGVAMNDYNDIISFPSTRGALLILK